MTLQIACYSLELPGTTLTTVWYKLNTNYMYEENRTFKKCRYSCEFYFIYTFLSKVPPSNNILGKLNIFYILSPSLWYMPIQFINSYQHSTNILLTVAQFYFVLALKHLIDTPFLPTIKPSEDLSMSSNTIQIQAQAQWWVYRVISLYNDKMYKEYEHHLILF